MLHGYKMIAMVMMLVSLVANSAEAVKNGTSPARDLIIVSCSGKSGSSTLEASFSALGMETIRNHKIDQKMIDLALLRSQNAKVLFIDSFRDPISRRISAYFHHLSTNLHLSHDEIRTRYRHRRIRFVQEILRDFEAKIKHTNLGYTFYHWRIFDYDCLTDGSFDQKKRYQLHKNGNLYFLNLRFSDISHWKEIIRSVDVPIDLQQLKIVTANVSEKKYYRDIYKDFLKNFTIKQEDFDWFLSKNSREIGHFYQNENEFIQKWKPCIR